MKLKIPKQKNKKILNTKAETERKTKNETLKQKHNILKQKHKERGIAFFVDSASFKISPTLHKVSRSIQIPRMNNFFHLKAETENHRSNKKYSLPATTTKHKRC